jgi:hypothetical protein
MMQSPSEGDDGPADEARCGTREVHYYVYNSLQPIPILEQMDPVKALTAYFFNR